MNERIRPPVGWEPLPIEEELKKYDNAVPFIKIPTPDEIKTTTTELLQKIQNKKAQIAPNPNPQTQIVVLTPQEEEWGKLKKKTDDKNEKTKAKRAAKREVIRSKKPDPPLFPLEGKRGVHEAMQKKPPKNLCQPSLLEIIVHQEKIDRQRMYPRDTRYGPDNNLTWSQFQLWARNFIPGWKDLGPEEKFNLLAVTEESKKGRRRK